ncbi:uncharacterized protein BJ171DRAFT_269939 [Polychytrium aggregatum]|uniref:uncharacterized protein n=1 Tax=Polychytrium aggregatum TaxID=110093 RepID=UPI0022FEAFA6|nr:uncharacterized protein BJ171DRAFT_269939 [Polychytrium aggregatum]KAI9193436.1 hypothetical protein BJ171DRAFT_269939 [Polychytrium aggregatum]
MRTSYNITSFCIHIYLIYNAVYRVLWWCPRSSYPRRDFYLFDNTSTPNGTGTGSGSAGLLSLLENTTCVLHPTSPPTFIHFTAWFQALFLLAVLLSHFWAPRLERLLYLHGLYLLNATMLLPAWILNSKRYGPGASFAAGLRMGWIPFILWWVLLYQRRHSITTWFWELEAKMTDCIVIERPPNDPSPGYLSTYKQEGRERLLGMSRIWRISSPVLLLTLWEWWLKPSGYLAVETTDLPMWPGLIWTTLGCAAAALPLVVYLSIFTFARAALIWIDPDESRGVVLDKMGDAMAVGLLY